MLTYVCLCVTHRHISILMCMSLRHFLVCETLSCQLPVSFSNREIYTTEEEKGEAEMQIEGIRLCASLPASGWELQTTKDDLFPGNMGLLVRPTCSRNPLALPNLYTAYKSQRCPLDLLQLLLHLGSICILVSHLSQPFQLHPYFLWHSFSPSEISAHWIMSQKTQTNTGFTCVNPPSSPWPDASIAAGF